MSRGQVGPGNFPEIPGYVILRQLGRGAFGVVLEGYQEALDRRVAIKVLRYDKESNEKVRKRFEREARLLSSLDHPHILSVYDFGLLDGGEIFLVTPLIEGGALDQRLRKQTLEASEAVSFFIPLADALAHAHDFGMMHRDIKPANVLLDPEGKPFLADFGLARLDGDRSTKITETGSLVGTPQYMPPELFRTGTYLLAGDVYSLALVMYISIRGIPPHGWVVSNEDLVKIYSLPAPDLPESLAPRPLCLLLRRCLDRDPDRRPTAAQLRDHLREIQEPGSTDPDTLELELDSESGVSLQASQDVPPTPISSPEIPIGAAAQSFDLASLTSPSAALHRGRWSRAVLWVGVFLLSLVLGTWGVQSWLRPRLESHWVEYGPEGFRVHCFTRNVLEVTTNHGGLQFRQTSPKNSPGDYSSTWAPNPSELPRTIEVFLEGRWSAPQVESIEIGARPEELWRTPAWPAPDIRILHRLLPARLFPSHESLRRPYWVRSSSDFEVPASFAEPPEEEPEGWELLLETSSFSTDRFFLSVDLEPFSNAGAFHFELVPGFPRPFFAKGPGQSRAMQAGARTLDFPRTALGSGAPLLFLPPPSEGPTESLRGVWFGTQGEGKLRGDDIEILLETLRTRICLLDRWIHPKIRSLSNFSGVTGSFWGESRPSRLGLAKDQGLLEKGREARLVSQIQALIGEISRRLQAFPLGTEEVPDLNALFLLRSFHRLTTCVRDSVLDPEFVPPAPQLRADYVRKLYAVSSSLARSEVTQPAIESLLREGRDLRPSFRPEHHPWLTYLERRTIFDATIANVYFGTDPDFDLVLESLEAVVHSLQDLPRDGFHPPHGGRLPLFREVLLILACTQPGFRMKQRSFQDVQGKALFDRVKGLISTRFQGEERRKLIEMARKLDPAFGKKIKP